MRNGSPRAVRQLCSGGVQAEPRGRTAGFYLSLLHERRLRGMCDPGGTLQREEGLGAGGGRWARRAWAAKCRYLPGSDPLGVGRGAAAPARPLSLGETLNPVS